MKKKTLSVFCLTMAMGLTMAGCSSKETTKASDITFASTEVTTTETTKEETTSASESSQDTSETGITINEEPSDFGDERNKFSKDRSTGEVKFSTRDREGKVVDDSIFSGHKVTMLNFFEPWCGPCVAEMPGLEKLSQSYESSDFQIIGFYAQYPSDDLDKEMDEVLAETKVTYPILFFTSELKDLTTEYVPTTVFVDENGNVITIENEDKLLVGSRSESDWKALIDKAIAQVSQ
ncbi:MAG: TlpA family protein disulfide reductase [Clostridiales bacterium]|nr:TlpA family protein disulfide reductase [Clostridiales bacterium]